MAEKTEKMEVDEPVIPVEKETKNDKPPKGDLNAITYESMLIFLHYLANNILFRSERMVFSARTW